jgi:hypothetical protein
LPSSGVAAEDIAKHLDGNLPVVVGVLGAIDDAHTACAEFFEDPVVRYGFADHGESLRWLFAHCNPKE